MTYFKDQRVIMTVTFTDADGAAFDPSTLEFRVARPDGSTDTYTQASSGVTNPTTGTWALSYVLPAAGWYRVTAESTQASYEAVVEARFKALSQQA